MDRPTLSPAAIATAEAIQRRPDVTALRNRLVRYRAGDMGYALARIMARNMIEEFAEEVAARWDTGLPLKGSWLDERLAAPQYRRITMTTEFEVWATATALLSEAARIPDA